MKCLLKLAALGVLLLLLLVGGVVAMINPIIEKAVTEGVGYTTQQDTTLESANLGIFSGDMSLEGLEIKNPPGFQETPLLKLGRFQTALAASGLAEDVIELDVVELDGLDLALEIKGTETNVTQLVERLQELQEQLKKARGVGGGSSGGGTGSKDPQESLPPEAGPVLKINRIRVAGVNANLRISEIPLIDGVYGFEVPEIVLENFSSDMQGATMVEWTAHVLESVIASSLAAAELELPAEVRSVLKSDLFKDEVLGTLLQGDLDDIDDKLEEKAKQEFDDYLENAKKDPVGAGNKALEDIDKGKKAFDDLFGGKDG